MNLHNDIDRFNCLTRKWVKCNMIELSLKWNLKINVYTCNSNWVDGSVREYVESIKYLRVKNKRQFAIEYSFYCNNICTKKSVRLRTFRLYAQIN